MPHICPRPCSRLATAAVFISVGVVQFVVGIILLRSKFVYLLAGPDFWTSACNIAVGCLLGVSASIWKNSKKRRPSKKNFLRRNLLLALLFSELLMNVTTLGIFLLGEGNTLISIRLENGKNYQKATFATEVLAYAYVTSVCCPIVCIVVTIVSMSGSCFKHTYTKKSSLETKTVVNTIKNERTEPLRWVYTPELSDSSKKKMHEFILSSSSESDEDPKDESTYHNYSNSSEKIHDVLGRMAEGKRDSMLSDSAIMLREMDLRRKNKYDSFDRDGSYVGPMLQRARESILGERQSQDQSTRHADLAETRVKKPARDYSDFNRSNVPLNDLTMKRTKYAKSRQLGTLYKNPYASEDLVNEYQKASSKMIKHYPSQYKKIREKFRSASDISNCGVRELAGIHKRPRMSDADLELGVLSAEYKDQRKWKSYEKVRVKEEENESFEETLPSFYPSPDGSDFGGDSIFEMSRRSSWAGDIVPISLKRTSGLKLSHKLIPVANPVVPLLPQKHVVPKLSDDSGIGSVKSSNFTEAASGENKNSLSSFQEDLTVRSNEAQEYPKMNSQSLKKYDMKVVKMASISEEANLEINNTSEESPERSHSRENVDLSSWVSYSGKKSPLRLKSTKEKNRNGVNLRRDTTIKRKGSTSSKALRKIWSMAMTESKNDFRDQVVDEDSLIGLSEEELIQRQLRTRSIRKVVQQRMREKVGM